MKNRPEVNPNLRFPPDALPQRGRPKKEARYKSKKEIALKKQERAQEKAAADAIETVQFEVLYVAVNNYLFVRVDVFQHGDFVCV